MTDSIFMLFGTCESSNGRGPVPSLPMPPLYLSLSIFHPEASTPRECSSSNELRARVTNSVLNDGIVEHVVMHHEFTTTSTASDFLWLPS